jgi:hypothetical protein
VSAGPAGLAAVVPAAGPRIEHGRPPMRPPFAAFDDKNNPGGRQGKDGVKLAVSVQSEAAGGAPKAVVATGSVKDTPVYVAYSYYPQGAVYGLAEGEFGVTQVRDKAFKLTWSVDAKFAGGTYEVAVWESMIEESKCAIADCQYCAFTGHHMEVMLAYQGGQFGGGVKGALNVRIDTDASTLEPRKLVMGADCSATAWIGYSIYPGTSVTGVSARHQAVEWRKGAATEEALGEKFCGGSYEVALWKEKVPLEKCRLNSCASCKEKGFHMAGLIACRSGYIPEMLKGRISAVVLADIQDRNTAAKVLVEAAALRGEAYLGSSFYPKDCKDEFAEGVHRVLPMPSKTFSETLEVPEGFTGGTVVVSLWGKRVPAKECTMVDCRWCKKNGCHMDQQLAITGVKLVPSVTARLASPTVARDTADGRLKLTVKGTAYGGSMWIGASMYPADASGQGRHSTHEVAAGAFTESFEIPEDFVGGTYAVAVWQNMVKKEGCKLENCAWCAAGGYHMDGWVSGTSGNIPEK